MSRTEIMRAYLAERFVGQRFVLLAIVLSGAAFLVSTKPAEPLIALLRTLTSAFLLILALRVWDDLADRTRDAVEHPNRITVRITSSNAFVILGESAAFGWIALMLTGRDSPSRLLLFIALCIALTIWYRTRRILGSSRLSAYAVLSKYPVIVVLIAPGQLRTPIIAVPVLVSLYLLLCIYETLDDPSLQPLIFGRGSQP
ncbi:MAG: hypothetical protein V4550_17485 [Gemmatimonadota bacterium]